MKLPYTKSGKCGGIVWQRARYGQICYPAFIPFNPRTPAQCAVRLTFAAVSKRWRTLTQAQRDVWIAVAWTMMSRPRLAQCGPLTGCQLFVKVNVRLANRGQPQVDLPPPCPGFPRLAIADLFCRRRFGQPPIGPLLFLQAHRLMDACRRAPRKVTALLPAPT